ncbi:hypothetical protein D9615_005577 [Tricholomella constricta]|uniref:Uncharacterized protein n=1 Tax=Tricholomella constricta TaxID=117010 RepID=A0A8H5HEF9_9AGAR|nr:hypothetical protein D9615_005577 [Tricholomella constricta]
MHLVGLGWDPLCLHNSQRPIKTSAPPSFSTSIHLRFPLPRNRIPSPMPSFRTLFILAATAFAAFSSAAPLDGGKGSSIGQSNNVLPVAAIADGSVHGVTIKDNEVTVIDKRTDAAGIISGLERRHDGELLSLCEVLVDVGDKLTVVSNRLTVMVTAKVAVEVEVIVGIVAEVKVILAGAVVQVKAIVGHPTEFVLSLGGKVLAIADVCQLLLTVLTLICAILSCVLRIVGTASVDIVLPLIASVGAVLVELLCVIFTLVDGLHIALQPLLGPVIQVCIALKLEAVVEVLNGKF